MRTTEDPNAELSPVASASVRAPLMARLGAAWTRISRAREAGASKLPTALQAYAAFAALFLFPGILKLIKVVHSARDGFQLLDLARVLASDAALACAGLALGLAATRLRRRAPHLALALGLGSTLALLLLLELSALEHQTWAQSSSLLDWNVLFYTIQHYQELRPVIAAETTVAGLALLFGAAALALLPLALDLLAARLFARELLSSGRVALAALACAALFALPALGSTRAPELCPLLPSASLGLIAGAFGAAKRVAAGSRNFAPPKTRDGAERLARALAAAPLALAGSPERPKNLLVLVLESTRFDATTPYVPRLPTTPRLAELAQHGALVARAYADMPHTSKALVSILCGYSPQISVHMNESEPGGLSRPCLPHLLGKLGYRRAFFQAAVGTFEDRHQFATNVGFDQVFTREAYDETGFEEVNYLSVEDKVMVQPILRFIDSQKQQPFLLTVLTCITHHSYGLPSTFPVREYPHEPALPGQRLPRPWPDYNRYLNTVKYADELLSDLVEGLRSRGLLEDTLIVVVGDHGQGFDEHGQRAHNTVIWDEGLHVPLVFSNPKSFPEPRVIEGVRSQADITPTVLGLLGVSYPPELFEGRDLLSAPPRSYVYSVCWYDHRCRAETAERLRVIDHFDSQPLEVYDLLADPAERRNLLAVGSNRERARYQKLADAARERMRANQRENEQRYAGDTLAQSDFVLRQAPNPTYPIHALVGDTVELLGYDAPTHEVAPDHFWDAVVYFKCLRPSVEGWRLFGELEAPDGRREQTDHHPANGRLFLHECRAGTIVADPIHVWIPDDFPAGPARYWWGSVFLKELGHAGGPNPRIERGEIRPLERGVLANDDSLLLAKLTVKPEYRPELNELRRASVLTQPPKLDRPLGVRFGRNLVLLEARATPAAPRRLASLTVRSVWRVEGPAEGPYQIAVWIESRTEQGRYARRAHTPVDGIHPISSWTAGTFVIDTDSMPIPEKMPLGEAQVWLSLGNEDVTLAIRDKGRAQVANDRVLLGTIRITE